MIKSGGKEYTINDFYTKILNDQKIKKKYIKPIRKLYIDGHKKDKLSVVNLILKFAKHCPRIGSMEPFIPDILDVLKGYEVTLKFQKYYEMSVKLLKTCCMYPEILAEVERCGGFPILLDFFQKAEDVMMVSHVCTVLASFLKLYPKYESFVNENLMGAILKFIPMNDTEIKRKRITTHPHGRQNYTKSVPTGMTHRAQSTNNIRATRSLVSKKKKKNSLVVKTIVARCVYGEETRLVHIHEGITLKRLERLIEREYGHRNWILKFYFEEDLITISKDIDVSLAITQKPVKLILAGTEELKITEGEKYPRKTRRVTLANIDEISNSPTSRISRLTSHPSSDGPGEIGSASSITDEICFYDLVFSNEKLGTGYFSCVEKANWKGTDVACKILLGRSFRNKSDYELFYREVEILRIARHPRIILYMGTTIEPDTNHLVIVTEYMKNGSLHDYLSNKTKCRRTIPTLGKALEIANHISLAMAYLHDLEEPILHRDLTSKNVLLDEILSAKVADFGLSKIDQTGVPTSNTIGTVAWMSPESILDPKKFVAKSDVYSFGVILWELCTGKSPHPSNLSTLQLANKITTENYRPPLPELCPTVLKTLIQCCWETDPNERPSFKLITPSLEELKEKMEHDKLHWVEEEVDSSDELSLIDNGYQD